MTAAKPRKGPGRGGPRVKPEGDRPERSDSPAQGGTGSHPVSAGLWEQFVSRENLGEALRRVERNAGAPGIDGMGTTELRPWLKVHWPQIRAQLDTGTYRPAPVRRVMIPKPSGGQRRLGVPTALDRLLQQALAQVLTPIFDTTFSDHSFGFRPGRSAHQAVEGARQAIRDGGAWAVDLDLDSFFDRVQHDALMGRVARRVQDKQVLALIRDYLEAGVMADGVRQVTAEGTPQGSPLSPLLSNIMLDDLDRELEGRGHRFARYADDVMIYVGSQRAGQRVMQSITQFIECRLKLRVNGNKSAVAPALERTFLGFGFYDRGAGIKLRVDPKARQRAKERVRRLTDRHWGVSMARRITQLNRFTVGWTGYFALAETPYLFPELDKWLRRRLRQVRWKEWKRPHTRGRNLRALGLSEADARATASSQKGYWHLAGTYPLQLAMPNSYWHKTLGLKGFAEPYRRFRDAARTARCGPACRVVWEGPGQARPLPDSMRGDWGGLG